MKLLRYTLPVTLWIIAGITLAAIPAGAGTVDTVRVGSPSLKGAAPFLGVDTIDSYVIEDGERTETNTQIRTIAAASINGVPVLNISVVHISLPSNDTTVNHTTIRTDDLSLLLHSVRAKTDSALVTYRDGRLTGYVTPPGEELRRIDTAMTPTFPDDGLSPWLLELLPFEDGYRASLPAFNVWMNRDKWQRVRVLGSETLTRNGHSVECWKVAVEAGGPPGYDQVRWISKTSRRVLQGVFRKGPEDPQFWGVNRHWF